MKDLNYWKNNGKDDYITTPINVLRYITELEKENGKKQLLIHSVVGQSEQLCHLCNTPLKEGVSIDYCTNHYCIKERA